MAADLAVWLKDRLAGQCETSEEQQERRWTPGKQGIDMRRFEERLVRQVHLDIGPGLADKEELAEFFAGMYSTLN